MAEKVFIDTAETAKRIRTILKGRWPTVKFSVRISRYSGGSSVSIHYTDGPRTRDVENAVSAYAGKRFDGMDDSTHYDTTIMVGPDGPRVEQHTAYILASRDVSDWERLRAESLEIIKARCVLDGNRFGGEWVDDLANGMARALDFTKGETLDTAFRRVVLREEAAA